MGSEKLAGRLGEAIPPGYEPEKPSHRGEGCQRRWKRGTLAGSRESPPATKIRRSANYGQRPCSFAIVTIGFAHFSIAFRYAIDRIGGQATAAEQNAAGGQ